MRPFAGYILPRYIARPEQEKFERIEELAVEVKDVKYKMPEQRKERFLGFDIFLSAHMTVTTNHRCATIQAVFFFSFWLVRHKKIFLKIPTIYPFQWASIPRAAAIRYF